MHSLVERIEHLKKKKNAVVLAHNYTLPEVQAVADFVGDSLGLSIEASKTDADIIIFCGVSFMGETAKLLNPNKKVILPVPEAYCAMASMCTAELLKDFKGRNPDAAVVGYVNSTAESKAEMDICCTSSNAVKVVMSLKEDDILFVPDRNLGRYVAKVTGKNIILWNGFCPVHHGITVEQARSLISIHPDAIIMAHPECRTDVLELADHIGSTESMVNLAKGDTSKEFIVLTEVGMRTKLEMTCPDKTFHFIPEAICNTMKMTSADSILKALEEETFEIILDDDIRDKATAPIKRMIDILP